MKHLLLVLAMVCSINGFAAEPANFNYQAKLTDSQGLPLNGSHTLFVSLFDGGIADAANSGAELYAETDSVNLVNGVVSLTIGNGVVTSGTLNSALFVFNDPIFVQVAVDSPDNVVLPRSALQSVPFAATALNCAPSLFGQFGGSGVDGDRVAGSGIAGLGAIRREYSNLTVTTSTHLSASDGWGFIGVQNRCTIFGSIFATTLGENGGSGTAASNGGNGQNATGQSSPVIGLIIGNTVSPPVPRCISGAGGGGGDSVHEGGSGGGAEAYGGLGGDTGNEAGQNAMTVISGQIMAGGVSSIAGSGQTRTSNFADLLLYRGAGGGGGGGGNTGGRGGAGGNGGGVVYIECGELYLYGQVNADGQNGGNGFVPVGQSDTAGGGGGGGGGVVLIRARKIVVNSGTVSTAGGAAGAGTGGAGAGGNGADGFWDVVQVP